MQTLETSGVKMRNRLDIRTITPGEVTIFDRVSNCEERLRARTVIVAAGQIPAPAPVGALEKLSIPYTVLGSAAVREGSNAAGTNLTSALRSAYQFAMDIR
jgi:2,4-dienoyl-CoA reductase (NADPH2)